MKSNSNPLRHLGPLPLGSVLIACLFLALCSSTALAQRPPSQAAAVKKALASLGMVNWEDEERVSNFWRFKANGPVLQPGGSSIVVTVELYDDRSALAKLFDGQASYLASGNEGQAGNFQAFQAADKAFSYTVTPSAFTTRQVGSIVTATGTASANLLCHKLWVRVALTKAASVPYNQIPGGDEAETRRLALSAIPEVRELAKRVIAALHENGVCVDSATLFAVDCREFEAVVAGAKQRIGLPLENEPSPEHITKLASKGSELYGVAADGVSLVLLRSEVNQPGKAHFSVHSPGALYPVLGSKPFQSGGERSLEVKTRPLGKDKYVAFALYRPPSSFGSGQGDGSVHFEVSYIFEGANDFGPKAERTIKLVRPPVVLVHGTYDNPGYCYEQHEASDDAPMNLAPKLRSIGFGDVFCTDWAETNGSKDPSDFITNQHTVWKNMNGIRDALEAMRRKFIAVTQADVVCHSQGGVIARVYARGFPLTTEMRDDHPHYRDPAKCAELGCWYHRWDNYNLGDIHRLITISTTHMGSAVCRLFLGFDSYYAELMKDPSAGRLAKSLWLDLFRAYVDANISGITTGGFYDQMPHSLKLNAIGPTPVPSHAIACVATDEDMWTTRPDSGGATSGMGNYYGKLYKILVGTPDDAKQFALKFLGDVEKKRDGNEVPLQNAAKFKELMDQYLELKWKPPLSAIGDALRGEPTIKQRLDQVIFHLRRTVFLDEENDCTVSISSSYGGLRAPYTTKAEHVLHGWAPKYRSVQNRVIELLCNDGNLFDRDGFPGAYSGVKSQASSFLVEPDAGATSSSKPVLPGKNYDIGTRPANTNSTTKPKRMDFDGMWYVRGAKGEVCVITFNANGTIYVETDKDEFGEGKFLDDSTIVVDYPDKKGLKGTMTADRKRIDWSSGEFWTKSPIK